MSSTHGNPAATTGPSKPSYVQGDYYGQAHVFQHQQAYAVSAAAALNAAYSAQQWAGQVYALHENAAKECAHQAYMYCLYDQMQHAPGPNQYDHELDFMARERTAKEHADRVYVAREYQAHGFAATAYAQALYRPGFCGPVPFNYTLGVFTPVTNLDEAARLAFGNEYALEAQTTQKTDREPIPEADQQERGDAENAESGTSDAIGACLTVDSGLNEGLVEHRELIAQQLATLRLTQKQPDHYYFQGIGIEAAVEDSRQVQLQQQPISPGDHRKHRQRLRQRRRQQKRQQNGRDSKTSLLQDLLTNGSKDTVVSIPNIFNDPAIVSMRNPSRPHEVQEMEHEVLPNDPSVVSMSGPTATDELEVRLQQTAQVLLNDPAVISICRPLKVTTALDGPLVPEAFLDNPAVDRKAMPISSTVSTEPSTYSAVYCDSASSETPSDMVGKMPDEIVEKGKQMGQGMKSAQALDNLRALPAKPEVVDWSEEVSAEEKYEAFMNISSEPSPNVKTTAAQATALDAVNPDVVEADAVSISMFFEERAEGLEGSPKVRIKLPEALRVN